MPHGFPAFAWTFCHSTDRMGCKCPCSLGLCTGRACFHDAFTAEAKTPGWQALHFEWLTMLWDTTGAPMSVSGGSRMLERINVCRLPATGGAPPDGALPPMLTCPGLLPPGTQAHVPLRGASPAPKPPVGSGPVSFLLPSCWELFFFLILTILGVHIQHIHTIHCAIHIFKATYENS